MPTFVIQLDSVEPCFWNGLIEVVKPGHKGVILGSHNDVAIVGPGELAEQIKTLPISVRSKCDTSLNPR
jgi:hypothetical protein